jgi:hypothetical protein
MSRRRAPPPPRIPDVPDVRDGLNRLERIILQELRRAAVELGREDVPTTLLYGRVVERIDVSVAELQAALERLGAASGNMRSR